MYCIYCGRKLEDGQTECPVCSKADEPTIEEAIVDESPQEEVLSDPIEDMSNELENLSNELNEAIEDESIIEEVKKDIDPATDSTEDDKIDQVEINDDNINETNKEDVKGPVFVPSSSQQKNGSNKLIAIIAVIIILIAGFFGFKTIQKSNNYKKAIECYDQAEYVKAYNLFNLLGDYKDSSYMKNMIGNYLESIYSDAEYYEYMQEYSLALEYYEQIPGYADVDARINALKVTIEPLKENYDAAMEYYEKGEFYKAKCLFEQSYGYLDARSYSQYCVQDTPVNGSFKTGSGNTSIDIYAPNDANTYIKIYNTNDECVAKVFVRKGQMSTVRLNGGTYTMKVGYGNYWYGEIDLFGDEGSYSKLMNGDSSLFTLSSNTDYYLKLMSVTDGNVGSESLDGAGGM